MLGPAPLIATPDAPIPEGAEASWLAGAGGVRLRAAIFTPPGQPRGSVVLSGGRTEPIEKYFELIQHFMDRGFVVLAHDWRGQGLSARALSDSLKGHADGYRAYLDDFRLLLAAYEERLPAPWIAVAHSMGGCLTLLAMAHGERRFKGAILSAPMLGLQTGGRPRSAVKLLVGLNRLLGRMRRYVLDDPGKPFDDDFESNTLTHDRRRFARACAQLAAEPRLALGGPTWGWLDFALHATREIGRPDRLKQITAPVIILSAEEDKLVDNAAQQAAARHLPQGKFVNIPGAYHEILMESDEMRNIFIKAFDALTGRVAPKPAEPPKAAPATPPKPPAPTSIATPSMGALSSAPTLRPAVPATAPTLAAKPLATPHWAAAGAPAALGSEPKPAAKKKASPKKTTAKKAPVKKAVVKSAAAKKAASAKKSAMKGPVMKKSTAKKSTAKKTKAKKSRTKAAAAAKSPTLKKKTAKKTTAKRKPARKTAAKKTTARKSTAKKSTARKSTAKKTTARKKTAAKKSTARKTVRKTAAKKSTARKSTAKKTTARKKTTAKKSTPVANVFPIKTAFFG